MIYIVSGYRRSGTSAMMTALSAGGLPVLSNSKLDEYTAKQQCIDGYKPTKNTLYEVGRAFYMTPGAVRKFVMESDDVAVKVFYDGLPILPSHDYTVVFMQRNMEEIKQSLQLVGNYRDVLLERKDRKEHEKLERNLSYPFNVYGEHRPEDVQHCLDIAKERKDMRVIEVEFKNLIESPEQTLENLEIPIDVEKAAKAIDPSWYRCVA